MVFSNANQLLDFLPPINIFSVAFWLFVLEGLALAFGGLALLSLGGKVQQVTFQMTGSRARKVVSAPRPTFGKVLSAISFAIAAILLILGASTFLNSRLFRAKSYANVIKVKDADFASDSQKQIFLTWLCSTVHQLRKLVTLTLERLIKFHNLAFQMIIVK